MRWVVVNYANGYSNAHRLNLKSNLLSPAVQLAFFENDHGAKGPITDNLVLSPLAHTNEYHSLYSAFFGPSVNLRLTVTVK